jgi:2-amino-4-hydroxy-6-hydroxymethyldihydropteridine diphosphokinase
MPSVSKAYIALGANLGDREANIRRALRELEAGGGIHVKRVSKLIANAAVGGPENAPDFLNGAAEIETTLSPHELLHRLLGVERALGRQRREKWAPRTIDLDLLLFGNQVISDDELQIPHPLMHQRKFVLEPLAEIAPNLLHPTLKVRVGQLLKQL